MNIAKVLRGGPLKRGLATTTSLSPEKEKFLQEFRKKIQDGPGMGDLAEDKYPTPVTTGPSLRKQLRDTRLAPWLKQKLPGGDTMPGYLRMKQSLQGLKLNTICREGRCPNIAECWGGGREHVSTATIMLLGDTCTRACRFCSVSTHPKPPSPDPAEPENTAQAVAQWGVGYIVVTMVNRDDLPDGGAAHVAETVRQLKAVDGGRILVECLVGDFAGNLESVRAVATSGLDVFAHNVETVERLTPMVRDRRASFAQSLRVLQEASEAQPGLLTKSSVMLGLGETPEDIRAALQGLRSAGVQAVTLGQYLQPDKTRMKVSRFVPPEEFQAWQREGEAMGFAYVASGPLVRSSYRAGEYFLENVLRAKGRKTSVPPYKTHVHPSPQADL
eukprot:RCo050850